MNITTNKLITYGYQARDNNSILGSLELEGANVRGCCIEIARDIAGQLSRYTNLDDSDFEIIRCEFRGEEMHYFVQLKSSCISDVNTNSGYVYVDASLDQFCDRQTETGFVTVSVGKYKNLDRVAIIPPQDSRREWYQNCIEGV